MYPLMVNHYRNVAVVVDHNPQYRRVLRCAGECVDIVKMTPEEHRQDGWQDHADPLGDMKFAHTFARSQFTKTERAMAIMEQIVKDTLTKLTLEQLNAEYRRLTHVEAGYKNREAALRAIKKISGLGGHADKTAKKAASGRAPKEAGTSRVMGRPRSKTVTPASLERAKKIAKAKRGVGALIVELLKKGKDNDTIASAAIKKFPKKDITPSRVAWYRSMCRTAKIKGV